MLVTNTISNNPMTKIKLKPIHPIRMIRKELALSQAALARLIGIKQAQLSACEIGLRNLSIKAGKKLITLAKKKGFCYHLEYIYPD
jgi:DNA-binding transcriptional regulator YiaG